MINPNKTYKRTYDCLIECNKFNETEILIITVLLQYWMTYKKINISNNRISKESGRCLRTVINVLNKLESLDLIKRESNYKEGKQLSNNIVINEENFNFFIKDELFIVDNKQGKVFIPTFNNKKVNNKNYED